MKITKITFVERCVKIDHRPHRSPIIGYPAPTHCRRYPSYVHLSHVLPWRDLWSPNYIWYFD